MREHSKWTARGSRLIVELVSYDRKNVFYRRCKTTNKLEDIQVLALAKFITQFEELDNVSSKSK